MIRRAVVGPALLFALLVAAGPPPSVGSVGGSAATPVPTFEPIPRDAAEATVTGVSDGDTIKVEVGGEPETVRLILVDTPETRRPNSPVECFGPEASARTKALLPEGTTVYLERDVSETDRYGRRLRYVWVPTDGDGRGYLFNERLTREGYAALYTYPPDVEYVERIRAAQQAAVEDGAGLWGECGGTDIPLGATPIAAPPDDAGSVLAAGEDRDCSDFATEAEEQAFFTTVGGPASDPHRLDSDGNGRACESLP